MKRYYISFLILFYIFLSIIAYVAIMDLIQNGIHFDLILLMVIIGSLVVLSAVIGKYLISQAEQFELSDSTVTLIFGKKRVLIHVSDIQVIKYSAMRYVIVCNNGKKFGVTRVKGLFQYETELNKDFVDFARKNGIQFLPVIF